MLQVLKAAIVLSFILIIACKPDKSYTINGTADESLNGKMIYLMRPDLKKAIDSTIITDGKFSFSGQTDTSVFCRLDVKESFGNIILEKGQIMVDLTTRKTSGTLLNNRLSAFFQEKDSLNAQYRSDLKQMREDIEDDDDFMEARMNYNNSFIPTYQAFLERVYKENPDNEIAPLILIEQTRELNPKQIDSLFNNLPNNYPLKNSNIQKIIASNQAYLNTDEGKTFVDFSIKTEDGQVALSDYVGKGKYTLVDFWASWCGPCRAEVPVIAEVYNQYKDKGLEVLGVAVWDKPEATINAIESLKMNWPQIINAESIPSDIYGINGIPHLILFAPDGTIVARGLRGEALKQKIAEVLKVQNSK